MEPRRLSAPLPAGGKPRPSTLGITGLALALALAQFRMIVFVFGEKYQSCMDAVSGVVTGHPHWRIFQSRILTPYLIDALDKVMPSYLAAHVLFSIAAIAVAGGLAWRLGARVGGPRGGVLGFVVFQLAFVLLLSRPWLYAWDFVDVIMFLLFCDFVVAERPWTWFVALAGVGTLNHEVASFIALWLIAQPLVQARIANTRVAWQPVAAGVVTFVAAQVLAELLRSALLVEQIGPKIFHDAPAEIGSSLYFTAGKNVELLVGSMKHFDYGFPLLIPAFIAVCIGVALWLARRDPLKFAALAITHVLVIGSLLVFGIIIETRIYLVLVPLLVLAATYATRDEPAPDVS